VGTWMRWGITVAERARCCELYVKFVADNCVRRADGGSPLMEDVTGDLVACVVVGMSRMTGSPILDVSTASMRARLMEDVMDPNDSWRVIR
jgi:hypothetical protein